MCVATTVSPVAPKSYTIEHESAAPGTLYTQKPRPHVAAALVLVVLLVMIFSVATLHGPGRLMTMSSPVIQPATDPLGDGGAHEPCTLM